MMKRVVNGGEHPDTYDHEDVINLVTTRPERELLFNRVILTLKLARYIVCPEPTFDLHPIPLPIYTGQTKDTIEKFKTFKGLWETHKLGHYKNFLKYCLGENEEVSEEHMQDSPAAHTQENMHPAPEFSPPASQLRDPGEINSPAVRPIKRRRSTSGPSTPPRGGQRKSHKKKQSKKKKKGGKMSKRKTATYKKTHRKKRSSQSHKGMAQKSKRRHRKRSRGRGKRTKQR